LTTQKVKGKGKEETNLGRAGEMMSRPGAGGRVRLE